MRARLGILVLVLAIATAGARGDDATAPPWRIAHDPAMDVFTVTAAPKVERPLNFGVNLRPMHFKPWSPFRFENLWNAEVGFEPILARHIITLKEPHNCSPTRVGELWKQRTTAGISFWGKYPDGWWTGAEIVHYRSEDGAYRAVHRSTVTEFRGQRGQEEWLGLADPGPVAQADDLFVLTKEMLELPFPDDEPNRSAKLHGFFRPTSAKVTAVIDPAHHAPEQGGRSSLRIALPGGRPEGMEQFFLQNREFYLMAPRGAAMRGELWMRQEGMATGQVTVRVGNQATATFTVTDTWRKFSLDFVFDPDKEPVHEERRFGPPQPESPRKESASKLSVTSPEAGVLWLDNLVVSETALPPFAVRPVHLEALTSFRPGTVRFWEGSGINKTVTLDAWLKPFPEMPTDPALKGVFGLPLPDALALCAQVGAAPWLVLYPMMSDEELDGLMEYLGAPPEVGYGKLRAAHGRREPWIGTFGAPIHLEAGNEAWNMIFQDKAWPGRPDQYAAVCERMFRRLRGSPHYDAAAIRLVGCGWAMEPYRARDRGTGEFLMAPERRQWSFRVAAGTPSLDTIDAAWYYGGADGVTVLGENDRELYAQQLMYAPWICAPQAEAFLLMREELRRDDPARRALELAAYEGGPGYPMPSAAKPFSAEGEIIGKSLVSGIVTLDAYLHNQALGFTAQNYYEYGVGPNFTSHGVEGVPIPAWMALEMRNRLCPGTMLEVIATDVKTIDIPTRTVAKLNWQGKATSREIRGRDGIAAVACHAFAEAEGGWRSILLLNRLYDEPRRVRLNLPGEPDAAAQIHLLTHADPRTHNLVAGQVAVTSSPIADFRNGYEAVLPPASAMVIVYRERP